MLLIAALLSMQWVGWLHSVAHAGWQGQSSLSYYAGNDDGSGSLPHSCTLFDALTLAATVQTPPYLALLLPLERMPALWVSYLSHIVRFIPHFCSRAPPSA